MIYIHICIYVYICICIYVYNLIHDVTDRIMTLLLLFQIIFTLGRPRVAIFANIIKIVIMFIKKIFIDLKKVKRTTNDISKYNLYLYFLIWQNLLFSSEKMLMSAELKGYVT